MRGGAGDRCRARPCSAAPGARAAPLLSAVRDAGSPEAGKGDGSAGSELQGLGLCPAASSSQPVVTAALGRDDRQERLHGTLLDSVWLNEGRGQ